MKKNIKVVILAVLAFSIILLGVLYVFVFSKAENILISNLTNSSLTITWESKVPSYSIVQCFEKDGKDKAVFRQNSFKRIHYVEIGDLLEKNYTCKVGNILFRGEEVSFETMPVNEEFLLPAYISGSVECEKKSCFDDAIVFISIEGYSLMSTKTNEMGNWTVDLSSARNMNSLQTKQFIEGDTIPNVKIWANAGSKGQSEEYYFENEIIVNSIIKEEIKLR